MWNERTATEKQYFTRADRTLKPPLCFLFHALLRLELDPFMFSRHCSEMQWSVYVETDSLKSKVMWNPSVIHFMASIIISCRSLQTHIPNMV